MNNFDNKHIFNDTYMKCVVSVDICNNQDLLYKLIRHGHLD